MRSNPLVSVDPGGLLPEKCKFDYSGYGKDFLKCLDKCWGDLGNFKSCVEKCLNKSLKGAALDLVCYIVACSQYNMDDPTTDPCKDKYDVECAKAAHFELTQCLCKAKTLVQTTVCGLEYGMKMMKCWRLQSIPSGP